MNRNASRSLAPRHPIVVAGIAVLCAMSFVVGMTTPWSAAQVTAPTGGTSAAAGHGGQKCPPTDPNLWPFGVVCKRDFNVPSPPEAPSLIPTIATKTTTRIWGKNPYQEAVSVTQHVWPAALPENAPNETNNVPDRPWGVTLVTPDDPLTGISAVPLLHFPDDAPLLYVTPTGIPTVTLNELKRLGDTGIVRANNVDAFLVGAASNNAVKSQLTSIGMTFVSVTGSNVFELANNVDKLYGSIQNPDEGVPQMETSSSTGGNGAEDVLIGSADGLDYQFYLPATHWASHMPAGLLWVHRNSIPGPTIDALKRRNGHALIYVFGGPSQISPSVMKTLNQYGSVTRISPDDAVAFNQPPTFTPINTALSFAKMWDPTGMVGWNILGPGHGFTLVNINDWQGAVASAPLSHLGFHAPLLLTDSPTTLPAEVDAYYKAVAPTFLTTPADGPYNMTYVIGDYARLSWPLQAHVDFDSEMSNRRVWSNNNGGRYSDSGNP
jgi:hypothetical protein